MPNVKHYTITGWGLIIDNVQQTCTIVNGVSDIGTADDNIDVLSFGTEAEALDWADTHGYTCYNPPLGQEQEEPAAEHEDLQ